MLEAIIQKAIRMGIAITRAKSIHVLRPPPSFQEQYSGIKVRRAMRR